MRFSIQHVVQLDSQQVSEQLMNEIAELRYSVWNSIVNEATRNSPEDWVDELDAISEHFLITERCRIIGAARLSIHQTAALVPDIIAINSDVPDWTPSFPIASINRLVVLPQSRGRGAARALDIARTQRAGQYGVKQIVGLASHWRVPQLAQLDFKELGVVSPITHKYDELPLYLMQRDFEPQASE